jgi:hypothetical protein
MAFRHSGWHKSSREEAEEVAADPRDVWRKKTRWSRLAQVAEEAEGDEVELVSAEAEEGDGEEVEQAVEEVEVAEEATTTTKRRRWCCRGGGRGRQGGDMDV